MADVAATGDVAPIKHAVQAVLPAAALCLPAGQSVQPAAAVASPSYPALHTHCPPEMALLALVHPHLSALAAPGACVEAPVGHAVQDVAVSANAYGLDVCVRERSFFSWNKPFKDSPQKFYEKSMKRKRKLQGSVLVLG